MQVEDAYALTLLTVAMIAILGYQRNVGLVYLVAIEIMWNVLAYMIGNAFPMLFAPYIGHPIWAYGLSTFATTLILGFFLILFLEFGFPRLVKGKKTPDNEFRARWVVRIGDRIVPVSTNDVAYFFSEDKSNYLMTYEGKRYIIDSTMDAIMSELDPSKFFRIGRGAIVAHKSIDSATANAGRYIVDVHPASDVTMQVSRSRAEAFIKWLG